MEREPSISFINLAESSAFAEFFSILWDLTGTVIGLTAPRWKDVKKLYSPEMMAPICQVIHSTPEGRCCSQS